ncbi:CinA family nicotinamide mononucleotide deamidase-related protein [Chitinophaga horti]|uniref:CinA-like protein n=1 Tax=Chitinophaga horti TaxID=2920382 RepID=A0ABY6IVC0_9BACT|nr:CinA family nicotinamide mononucleotide deamidase-related protein [Chitinophaga horti]UYQ91313.1 CinA family nicotinamide mononucleotide deamidase-related protein [Chitinophaga horti]
MEKIFASLITIGDELLIGQTIDTNSAWIAQQLNNIGVWVKRRVAVGDNKKDIIQALEEESRDAHIILITGGLGPTADDITKPVLNDYFGGRLIVHEETLHSVMAFFESRGLPVLQRNVDQARVPDTCQVLFNRRGTAPGMLFRKHDKLYVSMPGVPHEMKGIMEDYVLNIIKEEFHTPALLHQTLLTSGMGESFVAERIKKFEEALPASIKLAYLPNFGLLKLRLTAMGKDKISTAALLSEHFHELKSILEDIIVVDEDIPIEQVIGRLLKAAGKTMGTAESCTGGNIAHMITSVAGSSAYFKGSVVSYANEIKTSVLSVPESILQQYGAVSEETVKAMVAGGIKTLGSDYMVAVSGILGPDGGTEEKPVGTVWMAAGDSKDVVTIKHHFRYDRARNTDMASVAAINLLRKFITR